MENIKLTIFTPVYNRRKELINLFESLKKQSNKNFIWLIVDDGSEKAIDDLVNSFKKSTTFKINYIYQKNQGKHIAHNTGVINCNTDYFFCVDSDDTLSENAVEIIYSYLSLISKKNLIGLIAPRNNYYKNNLKLSEFETKLVKIVASEKSAIELAIVLKTSLLKKFFFPKFGNEKFLSEEILYNQLDKIGNFLFVNMVIYYSKYQDDGLTKNINSLWINNPIGTFELLKSRYSSFKYLNLRNKIYRQIRCTLVYDAFCIKKDFKKIIKFNNIFYSIMLFPLSYLVYLIKFKKIKG